MVRRVLFTKRNRFLTSTGRRRSATAAVVENDGGRPSFPLCSPTKGPPHRTAVRGPSRRAQPVDIVTYLIMSMVQPFGRGPVATAPTCTPSNVATVKTPFSVFLLFKVAFSGTIVNPTVSVNTELLRKKVGVKKMFDFLFVPAKCTYSKNVML